MAACYFFAGKYFTALKKYFGDEIEWDSEKAAKNWKKHKVAFEDAARVFLDKYRLDYYDELHSDDEERVKTVGIVLNVLAVIYTERGDKNRIISARRADKDEEAQYYEQFYD